MTFRIYYADGTTFDGDPFEAPSLDAILAVETDPDHGRRIVSGGDYMIWENDRWWAVDHMGMISYLLRTGPRRVLIGRMLSNEAYRDIYIRADEDADFPTRTAYGAFEEQLING